jgi:hypothetical protein
MRKGQNPAKFGTPAYQPKRLGIAILSYIPSTEGYFEHALQILQFQIASIYQSTPDGFDLWVLDNGSCVEAQAELHRLHTSGWIDFLVSSRYNIGKTGALNWILGNLPNELICYTDSDVLFRQGWLENSLRILESFPEAGVVTAQPNLFDVLRGSGKAHLAFKENPLYQVEPEMLDPGTIEEYVYGVGLPPERGALLMDSPVQMLTNRETGVKAVIGATHMQFIMPCSLAREIVPLPASRGLSRDEDVVLNQRVDQLGYLHLSTPMAYVFHMGNRLDDKICSEVKGFELLQEPRAAPKKQSPVTYKRAIRLLNTFSKNRFIKEMLRRLYILLFEYHAQ